MWVPNCVVHRIYVRTPDEINPCSQGDTSTVTMRSVTSSVKNECQVHRCGVWALRCKKREKPLYVRSVSSRPAVENCFAFLLVHSHGVECAVLINVYIV